MQSLKLRPEFLTKYMQATAIELCNQQNSGWAQRTDPDGTARHDLPNG